MRQNNKKDVDDYILPPILVMAGVAQLFITLTLDFPDSFNTFQIFNGATAGILIATGTYLHRRLQLTKAKSSESIPKIKHETNKR